ncbi:uncharacterized protein LOC119689217 [Teleopsis dalmanni]|uniref:uncharacterized protein LOC119689217 n=1 Tax=Teleopsis dalmanni TaxID=139649 RepID=UPI0018CCEDB3|nr:uncharacterized protein LOC119689217 [Teleopsis dalmanni]
MVDGKVCNAFTETTSTQKCYLCGATSAKFNSIDEMIAKNVETSSLSFGLSRLKMEVEQLKKDRDLDRKELNKIVIEKKRRNLIVKGMVKEESLNNAFKKLCNDKLGLYDISIQNTRLMFEKNNKMNIVVSLDTTEMAQQVLRSKTKLVGSKIYIERDLSEVQLQKKRALMQLMSLDNGQKVSVRNDSIRIDGKWMYFNSAENEVDYIVNKIKNHVSYWVPATKEASRGRAIGGMLYGIKKEVYDKGIAQFNKMANFMVVELKLEDQKAYIVPVYINCNNWDADFTDLRDALYDIDNMNAMVIGDFNGRIGNAQAIEFIPELPQGNAKLQRNANALTLDRNGKKLIQLFNALGLTVMNGRISDDLEGEITFVRGGATSTIDYCVLKGFFLNIIQQLSIQEKIYSNHLPVEINLDQLLNSNVMCEATADEMIAALTTVINEAASPFQQGPTKRKRNKDWFDEECEIARTNSFNNLKMARKRGLVSDWNEYKTAKNGYRIICYNKRIQHTNDLALSLSSVKDSKSFWNNILATQNELDKKIEVGELTEVLERCKENKAPGEDRIPAEFLKFASAKGITRITEIFNYIYDNAEVPGCFKNSIVFPLFYPHEVKNYRGISFLNSIAKVFTGILHQRLQSWVDDKKLLSEFQVGFRRGYSTVDNVFILTNIAKLYVEKEKKLYVFFVDFKATFDSIGRDAMFYKLSNYGVFTKMLNILRALYCNTTAAVWDGNSLSKWFSSNTGVKQGCLIRPLLFALFIDDLNNYLSEGILIIGTCIKLLLYADDLVLMADSPLKMQTMINELYSYCMIWKLKVNISKSKIMIFKRNCRRLMKNEIWNLNGEALEVVKEYKYLGVWISYNGKFNEHLSKKLSEARKAINSSWKVILGKNEVALSVKFQVFKAAVRSILFYAVQVWGIDELNEVEMFQSLHRAFYSTQNSTEVITVN